MIKTEFENALIKLINSFKLSNLKEAKPIEAFNVPIEFLKHVND